MNYLCVPYYIKLKVIGNERPFYFRSLMKCTLCQDWSLIKTLVKFMVFIYNASLISCDKVFNVRGIEEGNVMSL